MAALFDRHTIEDLRHNTWRYDKLAVASSLLVSIIVVYFAWNLTEAFYKQRAYERLKYYAHEHAHRIEETLQSYENILRTVMGLLLVNPSTNAVEWREFITNIDPKNHYAGIQGIGYSEFFWDETTRQGHSEIVYLEPLDVRNKRAIGFDMFSEPVRREAMLRALETGNVAMTGAVRLVQEIDDNLQNGFLIYLPFYAHPPQTLQDRYEKIQGFVYAPFRSGDFVQSINAYKEMFYVDIKEITDADGVENFYEEAHEAGTPLYHVHMTMRFGGRVWQMDYHSTPQFEKRYRSDVPALIALAVMIVIMILNGIIIDLLRKRALLKAKQLEIVRSHAWLERLLSFSADGIHILDMKGRLVHGSATFLQMIGRTKEQAKQLSVYDWDPQVTPQMLRDIQMELHSKPMSLETQFVQADGTTIDVEIKVRAVVDEDEIYFFVSSWDITRRKEAERFLKESEAFYKTIFASVNEAILILHQERIIDANDLALHLLNASRESLLQKNITELVSSVECRNESWQTHIDRAYTQGFATTECSLKLHSDPEHSKIVEFTFSRFGETNEQKLVIIARDMTQKVEEERLLTMHARQAQMGEMISMIAHQWRQPLAIINAITSQMRLKLILSGDEENALVDQLVKIEEQSGHLSQTISDYRNFFRPDKEKEHFYIAALVDHALELMDHTLKNHSIKIEKKILGNPQIYSFRNEVLQVLLSLFKNSFDAFVERGIKGGCITITTEAGAESCAIRITDNAGGIEDGVMKKLFIPYFTTKQQQHGTGLGLYMSRKIIQEHCHGTIIATSMGDETTFVIHLPYEKPQSKESA